MKKPTRQSREWNRVHARLSNKRRLATRENRKSRLRKQSAQSRPTKQIRGRRAAIEIVCPREFSLETNFNGVVNTLRKIRQQSTRVRNEGAYVDFRRIRTLSPAAALVLAAELDRWSNILFRSRLRTIDVHEWDPNVRRLLNDMGFFDLLEVEGPGLPDAPKKGDTRYVKFRSGRKADGEAIDRLRAEDLEPIAGQLPNRVRLYNAVTEAMTNVVQHAYQHKSRRQAAWWLSASHDARGVTIMIYDQGSGIPATLPRNHRERLRDNFFSEDFFRDHARMIQAAHDLSRTRTREPYRGHGLERDVRGYISHIGEGYYRVTSQKGEYLVERSADGSERPILTSHSHPLRGTLIEWRVSK